MCVAPRPSLKIVEDADLVAAEASQTTDMNDSSTDALDEVCHSTGSLR